MSPSEIFSPDNDGYNDVLSIHYSLNKEGYTGSIVIYDASGRQNRFLVNNDILGTQGTYIWDGIDDEGQKAKTGIYVVYIELVNLNGNIENIKKTCVVGGRFE